MTKLVNLKPFILSILLTVNTDFCLAEQGGSGTGGANAVKTANGWKLKDLTSPHESAYEVSEPKSGYTEVTYKYVKNFFDCEGVNNLKNILKAIGYDFLDQLNEGATKTTTNFFHSFSPSTASPALGSNKQNSVAVYQDGLLLITGAYDQLINDKHRCGVQVHEKLREIGYFAHTPLSDGQIEKWTKTIVENEYKATPEQLQEMVDVLKSSGNISNIKSYRNSTLDRFLAGGHEFKVISLELLNFLKKLPDLPVGTEKLENRIADFQQWGGTEDCYLELKKGFRNVTGRICRGDFFNFIENQNDGILRMTSDIEFHAKLNNYSSSLLDLITEKSNKMLQASNGIRLIYREILLSSEVVNSAIESLETIPAHISSESFENCFSYQNFSFVDVSYCK